MFDQKKIIQGQSLEPIAEVPRTDAIVVDREFSYVGKRKIFSEKYSSEIKLARTLIINLIFGGYFAWASYHFIKNSTCRENNQAL